MNTILYEETLGSYSCRHIIHMCKSVRFILSELNVGHSIEVCRYGCQENPQGHDVITPPPRHCLTHGGILSQCSPQHTIYVEEIILIDLAGTWDCVLKPF